MTTGKLVSNLRNSDSSHLDLSKSQIFFVRSYDNLINDAALSVFQGGRAVFELSGGSLDLALIEAISRLFGSFSDNNIVTTDEHTWFNQSIMIELIIAAAFPSRRLIECEIRDTELFITLLLVIICAEEHGPEESSVNGTLVQHDGVLLVVTRVASDCND